MTDDPLARCFEVLELAPGASLPEVRKAYLQLRQFYADGSLATLALEGEFDAGRQKEILEQVEEAYQCLRAHFAALPGSAALAGTEVAVPRERPAPEGDRRLDGPGLRLVREALDVSLEEMSRTTRIPVRSLENLEKENYAALPAEVFLRGFVVNIARYLELDPARAAADYLQGYASWKKRPPSGGGGFWRRWGRKKGTTA